MSYIKNSQEFNNHDTKNILPNHTLIKTSQQDRDLESIRLQKQLNLFKQLRQQEAKELEEVEDSEEEDYVLTFENNKVTIKEKSQSEGENDTP